MKKVCILAASVLIVLWATASCVSTPDNGAAGKIQRGSDEPPSSVMLGELPDGLIPFFAGPTLSSLIDPEPAGAKTQSNTSAVIDYSHTEDGYIMAAWLGGEEAVLRFRLEGPNGTVYQYELPADGYYETFPLSCGSGGYSGGIFRQTEENGYSAILSVTFYADLKSEFSPYLDPNQYVSYLEDGSAARKAAELCEGETDVLEEARAICGFVAGNIAYRRPGSTAADERPTDADTVLEKGEGASFDIAALITAMLRSRGIPTKMVVGYRDGAYYAWLNLYEESQGWVNGAIYYDGNDWVFHNDSSGGDGSPENPEEERRPFTAKYQY